MSISPCLLHAAVHSDTKEHAHLYFCKVLGLQLVKTFTIDEALSTNIFSLPKPVDIWVFGNESMQIEVFIHPMSHHPSFNHLCLQVDDKAVFINRCKKYGLMPYQVQKGEKHLLFVRDFTGNLYEIKEEKK